METIPGYEAAFRRTEERIEQALNGAPGLVRAYMAHLAGTRGKMLRAAALLACAQKEGGVVPADAVSFAAGVELLHLATLVHDDVIDDADLRRGQPTLQRKFGRRTAVICGDYLLSLALRLAAEVSDRERYLKLQMPDYAGRVCLGELRQQMNRRNFGLSVFQYLRIIRGKTAALFEASYLAGAILCTDDHRQIRRYARLGRETGMLFQLTDDCIDFELDEKRAGKNVQSDYEQGVVTLPLIHTLRQDPALREQAERNTISLDELNCRVRGHGGLEYTHRLSKAYYDRAAKRMGIMELCAEKRRRLMELLDKAYYGPQKQGKQENRTADGIFGPRKEKTE